MMNMTHTTFDTDAHPRSASSGRFTEAEHSAPETRLTAPGLRPLDAQAAIEAVTHGRDTLDRSIGTGRFGYTELEEARNLVWNGASGTAGGDPSELVGIGKVPLNAHEVEQALEVTYYRATSGRYAAEPGSLSLVPVDEAELRNADWQATGRSEHVEAMWESAQQVGPEAEISDHNARLFAEDALQNLPENLSITSFPRLAEFANAPYTEAGGASPQKVDALHEEIARVRSGHSYLAPHKHRRLDMLATFATHALPGQD